MSGRLRVLVSAYGCEPGAGSEPGAGWEWSVAAAERHQVWLLTRANNVDVVRAELRERPDVDVTVVGYDLPRPLPWLKKRVPGGAHLYYVAWQWGIVRLVRRLHAEVGFDVAHHLTWSTDWLPAGVARLQDVPFVWGPIGGATRTPWRHWRWFGVRGVFAEAVRAVGIPTARRVGARRSFRRSSLILAQNNDELRLIKNGVPVLVEPHIALRDLPVPPPKMNEPRRTAIFAGRALYWKGLRLAVATLAEPDARDWELHVYGQGRDLAAARRLASSLRVDDRVVFHGHADRARLLAAIGLADALLFPSFHDAGGWIVAEAISSACPVVCLDIGGPAVLVGTHDGQKVDIASPDLPRSLACALAGLRTSPSVGKRAASGRWTVERLPALLERSYASVAR
jgi:glycosyltransferase involved in cell wall biosynthesis